MIDLSQLTEEQLNELELQIQKHKKNALESLKGYRVTFYVRFAPENHKNDVMLTDNGELDTNSFADYLYDNVASKLIMGFELYDYEDVSYPIVDVATKQEIEEKF